jgi:hypothetical protein
MNSALTYKNNTVYWIPAIGAVAYEVKVNGVVVAENVSGNSQVIKLTREGINTIEVRFTDVAGSAVAKIDVMAHAVTYYPRNNTAAFTEYYAVGDTMTLPRDIVYNGFDFSNWYTSPNGAAGNGKLYAEGTVFSEYGSIALFADWTPKTYNAILQTEGYGIGNIEDQAQSPVVYTQGFTLPVPASSNAESLIFAGWFTGPAGTGDQLTDANGKVIYYYSDTEGKRNVSDIATAAFYDLKPTAQQGYSYYVYSDIAKGLYSPYSKSQRAILASLIKENDNGDPGASDIF